MGWFGFSHHGEEIFLLKHGRAVREPPLDLFVFLQLFGIPGGGIEENPSYVHPNIVRDRIHHMLDFHDALQRDGGTQATAPESGFFPLNVPPG